VISYIQEVEIKDRDALFDVATSLGKKGYITTRINKYFLMTDQEKIESLVETYAEYQPELIISLFKHFGIEDETFRERTAKKNSRVYRRAAGTLNG
jgi:hypothetical protein